jgi:hypothetical protein
VWPAAAPIAFFTIDKISARCCCCCCCVCRPSHDGRVPVPLVDGGDGVQRLLRHLLAEGAQVLLKLREAGGADDSGGDEPPARVGLRCWSVSPAAAHVCACMLVMCVHACWSVSPAAAHVCACMLQECVQPAWLVACCRHNCLHVHSMQLLSNADATSACQQCRLQH